MRLLALDVGRQRIGVAVCDELGMIATPRTVVHHTSKGEDFRRIAELVREEQAAGIVMGHPLNEDGSVGPQARYVEGWASELEAALQAWGLDVPITLWDEYGTTQQAQAAMIASGRKARDRREWIDAAAAAAILQSYLDARRPPPAPPLPER
jgi:putative Holliday junction resolvase